MSAHTSPSPTTLHGQRLLLARVIWVVLAALTLGVFVISVPVRYSQLSHPSASVRAALEEIGLSPGLYALYNVALDTIFVSVCALVAIFIFLRRSGDPMALLVATMLVLWGTWNDLFVVTPRAIEGIHPLMDATVALLSYAGYMAWMLFFYLFPSGRFVPRWTRWMALCWVLFSGSWLFTPFGPPTWPIAIFSAAVTVLWGSFLVAQVYRYARVSDAVPRHSGAH